MPDDASFKRSKRVVGKHLYPPRKRVCNVKQQQITPEDVALDIVGADLVKHRGDGVLEALVRHKRQQGHACTRAAVSLWMHARMHMYMRRREWIKSGQATGDRRKWLRANRKCGDATHNLQPITYNPNSTTQIPQPTTHNPQPTTHNPQPTNHNPQPDICNP